MKIPLFLIGLWASSALGIASPSNHFALKAHPEEALLILQNGNKRFSAGHALHPHTTIKRLAMAGSENQGRHAIATIIAGSDSRLPVEMIFDAGVMDIFSIRIMGNLCNEATIASLEYGINQVNTPLVVFLGNTQCNAMTLATHLATHTPEDGQVEPDHDHIGNVTPVMKQLTPAVEAVQTRHPHLHPEQIIPLAIEENIWMQMSHFLANSPSSRQLILAGKVKIMGAVYDVGSGTVHWLPQEKADQLMKAYLPEIPPEPEKKPIFSFLRPKEETAMNESSNDEADSEAPVETATSKSEAIAAALNPE